MSAGIVIGITGGSGSGKTHFLNQLMDSVSPGTISIFSIDNYYLPIDQQQKDENGIENFDLPESLDRDRCAGDLKRLISGETLRIKEYTFNYFNVEPRYIEIPAAPVIIVEGIFTFYFPEINELLDLKIFIDTPVHMMVKRRIIRDAKERGYDMEDVLYRFEHHVMPAYNRYIIPTKDQANLIVPNHGDFDAAIDVISSHIQQYSKSEL